MKTVNAVNKLEKKGYEVEIVNDRLYRAYAPNGHDVIEFLNQYDDAMRFTVVSIENLHESADLSTPVKNLKNAMAITQ